MSLKDRLQTEIAANEPMRLDHYIERALFDETDGYYATHEVFGVEGDFITAPEISQIFGELCGLWVVFEWQRIGSPERFALIELGAGRGVWMRDILRAMGSAPECHSAAEIHIVEKSERRRAEQVETIGQVTHLDEFTPPDLPSIVISNEFFDALPIRQFRAEGGGWLEAFVDGGLTRIWRPCPRPPEGIARLSDSGSVIEWNADAVDMAAQISAHIRAHGGAMLAIDYGDWDGVGDTLQAVLDHETSDPFAAPGQADITAHVRFRDLAAAMALPPQFTTQGAFLNALGGEARRDVLIAKNPTLADQIRADYHRLSAPDEMGELFKVLIIESEQ